MIAATLRATLRTTAPEARLCARRRLPSPLPSPSPVVRPPCGGRAAVERFGRGAPFFDPEGWCSSSRLGSRGTGAALRRCSLPASPRAIPVRTLPAMVMFKWVATEKLKLFWFMFLMANAIRVFPANPTSNCGMDVYQRVILTLDLHVLTALAAAVLLLAVRMAVSAAESNAVTVLRIAVSAAESNAVAASRAIYAGAKAYDAYHEAEAAAAAVEGIGSIASKWRRVSLRGMLLLSVVLSTATSLLAVVALEDGYAYWISCEGVFVTVLMVLVHGSSAWTAVSEN